MADRSCPTQTAGPATAAAPLPPPPSIVRIGVQPWRLRAEAIARYQAARQQGKPATKKAVEKEFQHLVSSELKPGREAILFLNASEHAKAKYGVNGVVHWSPFFEQLKKEIREIIKTGSVSPGRSVDG